MTDLDPISVANRWIEAYNAKDYDTLKTLIGEQIHMVHHNRGVDVTGSEAALGLMYGADEALSVKRFHSTRRQFTDGERVVTEHSWEAAATVEIPGIVAAGESVDLELCSVWTVRDGKVVGYDDYG